MKTKLDLMLDRVDRTREITFDVRDWNQADKQRLTETAAARALDVSTDGQYILVRPALDDAPDKRATPARHYHQVYPPQNSPNCTKY